MVVRDERYVRLTGYAGLSIGPFNELGLEVLSNVTREENVFYSKATDLAGPLNWNRNWNWNWSTGETGDENQFSCHR
jgi:hypothetical protein